MRIKSDTGRIYDYFLTSFFTQILLLTLLYDLIHFSITLLTYYALQFHPECCLSFIISHTQNTYQFLAPQKSPMIQSAKLIRGLLTQFQPYYKFSKILKLKPLTDIQITTAKLSKNISSAIAFFTQIQAPKKVNTPKIQLTENQIFQEFIYSIAQIDIEAFQKKINDRTNPQQFKEIFQKLKRLDIVTNTVELLIAQPQYTHLLKKFLTNFMNCLCIIFRKDILHSKPTNMDLNFAIKCCSFFNEYIILTDFSDKFVINFCLFMTYVKLINAIDANRAFFSNQKIIIDYILQRNDKFAMSKKDTSIIFGYVSSTNVGQNYPTKYSAILRQLNSLLSPQWYMDPDYNVRKLIILFERMRFDSEKITYGMKYWIGQGINYGNFFTVVGSINELMKLKPKIYYGETVPEEYGNAMKNIMRFMKRHCSKINTQKSSSTKNPKNNIEQAPKHLIPTLYRSSIWIEQVWLYLAEWIQTDLNYKTLLIVDLYNIYRLMQIDKQVIPKTVIDRLKKTYEFLLLKHNFRIQSVDLIKQYHKSFGDRMLSHYSVQQQICNNLRSVSKKKITAQVLVDMFIVDILVNDKIIIEINGFSHYIENEKGEKISSLKGAFKKRILEKLGYRFLEYSVASVVDGNLELLKTINDDIQKMGCLES